MDNLLVKHPGGFNQKSVLDFYFKLLLLLQNVVHNHSLTQRCLMRTEQFPNFTSDAGSPFFFRLPITANPGHMKHYQLSLADGDGPLPHWMVFRQHTSILAGLALTEDCGIYRLKVSVHGGKCAAHFHLHILNRTVTDKSLTRSALSCSKGEMIIWANLLLQLNPFTLDASQRIRLVSAMADYLRLLLSFVFLFSQRKSLMLKQEQLRVCRQGGLAEKQDAMEDVAELLWPVGCQDEDRQSDLAKILEHTMRPGGLASLLGAPVLGWRVLCPGGEVQHKVKRDLQRQKFTPTPNMIVPPPSRVQQGVKVSHVYALPVKLEPSLSTFLLHMNHVGTKLEPTHTKDSTGNTVISGYFSRETETFPDLSEKASRFTCERHISTYQSDINPEMQVIPPTSLFSVEQTHFYTYMGVNALLERQAFTDKSMWTAMHTAICMEFGCSDTQPRIKQTGLPDSKLTPPVEATGCSEEVSTSDTSLSISEYSWTTELFASPHLPTVAHVVPTMLDLESFNTHALSTLPSRRPHSIYPSLRLTPASSSVTSPVTHDAVHRESLATRLTLQPHQKETPLWTESYTANHTDSESQPTVSSHGHTVDNQEPVKDHSTAKSALHNLLPVSTEDYSDVPLLTSTLNTVQPLPSSIKTPPTQLFPDVSPNLMTEQLSVTQHSDTISYLSPVPSGMNQDVMSQLNVPTQVVSSTTITGQLITSGETELESSHSTALLYSLEPSVTASTPALPSEIPGITNPVESLKVSSPLMPLLQTSISSLPDSGASSLQQNLEDLMSALSTQVYFDQTLSLGTVLLSLLPTYLSWPVTMSLPPSNSSQIIIPSVEQTLLQTLLLENSRQIEFSHISFVPGITTGTFLNSTLLTISPPVLKTVRVTYPLSVFWTTTPVSEGYFDSTAPSAAQETYTTSSSQHMQSLEPSFPLCGNSAAQDVSVCTPPVESTTLENTREHAVTFLTNKYSTDLPTFSVFDSSRQSFSAETLVEYLSLHPTGLLSGDVLEGHTETNVFASLLLASTMELSVSKTSAINHVASNQQMDLSETLPPSQGSGFSMITHTSLTLSTSDLRGHCDGLETSLLICKSSATQSPITKGLPTLSTYLSLSKGMSLLPSLPASGPSSYRTQSSVQPSRSSASISSSLNLPPQVLQSLPALMATVGFPFHYSIPPETFVDPEDGEATDLSLEMQLIDRPPASVGTWLALDGLELHGVPLEVDLQFAPQDLLLVARDSWGLSTWLPLTLDLRRSPVDPCHVFTLTAQRSLHSMLRHRHRVELLLRKLSSFFNSSSNHHLSVVSMTPGSTVVSWYNYSLCETRQIRVTHCHIDQIRSMWSSMRSSDGSVNPAFREAMLPEFPITKVGSVRFRHDCFPTTPPPTFGSTTPAVHTTLNPGSGTNTSLSPTSNTCVPACPAVTHTPQQRDSYHWRDGVLTALLVVCLLILILLLVAAVLYFCRGHGRSRTVAIWPAGRLLSVQGIDLTAIKPRRPPRLRPELPPPPLRLWISLSHDDEWQLISDYEQDRKSLERTLQPRPPQRDL